MWALIYTFRTSPFIPILKECAREVVIFGKLREDFERFKKTIQLKQPQVILGVAQSTTGESILEAVALNKFNKTKLINRKGPPSYRLHIPTENSTKSPKYRNVEQTRFATGPCIISAIFWLRMNLKQNMFSFISPHQIFQ